MSWITLGTWESFGGFGIDHFRSIFFVYPISQPVLEILTQNFQDMGTRVSFGWVMIMELLKMIMMIKL